MIKMVNEFKLTVVHFARPNPMQICACAWIYRWTKKLWKIRTGQDWAAGPPGRRAVAGRGSRAAGPSGRRTAGPSRAAGRWAAGLRLAKPKIGCYKIAVIICRNEDYVLHPVYFYPFVSRGDSINTSIHIRLYSYFVFHQSNKQQVYLRF